MHRVVAVKRQSNLVLVVATARLPCSFASELDSRQQQSNQNANDRNHDQQFDHRKRLAMLTAQL